MNSGCADRAVNRLPLCWLPIARLALPSPLRRAEGRATLGMAMTRRDSERRASLKTSPFDAAKILRLRNLETVT